MAKRFYSQFVESGMYAVRDHQSKTFYQLFGNSKAARASAKELNDREEISQMINELNAKDSFSNAFWAD